MEVSWAHGWFSHQLVKQHLSFTGCHLVFPNEGDIRIVGVSTCPEPSQNYGMAIVKTPLVVVNSIQLAHQALASLLAKSFLQDYLLQEKSTSFLFPWWSNGRKKTNSLEHEDFGQPFSCQLLEHHVFCQHQSHIRASSSLSLVKRMKQSYRNTFSKQIFFWRQARTSYKNPQRLWRDTSGFGSRDDFAKDVHIGSPDVLLLQVTADTHHQDLVPLWCLEIGLNSWPGVWDHCSLISWVDFQTQLSMQSFQNVGIASVLFRAEWIHSRKTVWRQAGCTALWPSEHYKRLIESFSF